MEQTNIYRSPYRTKNIERIGPPTVFKKIIKQTIYCVCILLIVFFANNIQIIKTSSIWQSIIDMFGYDMDIERTCQTFNNALMYIKGKMPQENEKNISESDDIVQMQKDVSDIKAITKVLRPVSGIATSRFGKRVDSQGIEQLHTGVDLAADIGTPVRAAISGKVIEVKELTDSFGKFVRIQNDDVVTTYAHCSTIEVNVDDEIVQGEVIAYSGDTGNVTGPHLHFEIVKDGRYVDPGFLLPS